MSAALMAMRLKGDDVAKLGELKKAIQDLPRTLGIKVAKACADVISGMARRTFAASQDSFGDPWAPSNAGKTVTLKRSGDLAKGVDYVATGTRLRARLGPRYAKYQVGLRSVFPRSSLPLAYRKAIDKKAREIIGASLGRV